MNQPTDNLFEPTEADFWEQHDEYVYEIQHRIVVIMTTARKNIDEGMTKRHEKLLSDVKEFINEHWNQYQWEIMKLVILYHELDAYDLRMEE